MTQPHPSAGPGSSEERVEFNPCGQSRSGTERGRRQGSRGNGTDGRLPQPCAPGESVGKRCTERVAGSGRVDDPDPGSGNQLDRTGVDDRGSLGTQGYDRGGRRDVHGRRRVRVSGERLQLATIGNEHVDVHQQLLGERLGRSRIEDNEACGNSRRSGYGLDRYLQLEKHDLLPPYHVALRLDISDQVSCVRSRTRDDRVLARFVDHHNGRPGRDIRVDHDATDVDTLGGKGAEQLPAGLAGADPSDERHVATQPGGTDGLVGAFPPGSRSRIWSHAATQPS